MVGSIAFMVFIVLSHAGVAQERTISQSEFDKIYQAAGRLSYSRPVRTTMHSKHLRNITDDKFVMITEISEFMDKGTKRIVRTEENPYQGKTRTETITIGDDRYERVNDSKWQKHSISKMINGTGGFTMEELPLRRKEFTFRCLGRVDFEGKATELYESRMLREYEGQPAYTSIERIWIQPDGTMLRTESKTVESNGRVTFEMEVDFEYPKDLAIKPPSEVN